MDRKELLSLYKRFFIVFGCLLPLLLGLGVLMGGDVSNGVQIAIFVVIAGIVFLIEEMISTKLQQKRLEKREAYEKERKQAKKITKNNGKKK